MDEDRRKEVYIWTGVDLASEPDGTAVHARNADPFRDPDAYTRQMIEAACASPVRTIPGDEGDWDVVTNVRLVEIDAMFKTHAQPPRITRIDAPFQYQVGQSVIATYPAPKPLSEDDRALHRALSRSKGTFSRESQCGWIGDE